MALKWTTESIATGDETSCLGF